MQEHRAAGQVITANLYVTTGTTCSYVRNCNLNDGLNDPIWHNGESAVQVVAIESRLSACWELNFRGH
ncbi:hypothetical protein [Pseudomonas glycinae]|uniref:Uncharacterized protein n=1 Tax=Pseudomonas glycinae TaxID=1785145 RepID=A0ABN5FPN8_9PSED|nr:hypothetical protein [Pseudomonas glycinae]AUG97617.1 hypothetical protein AWU82_29845 [Pseudomonas glycinae]